MNHAAALKYFAEAGAPVLMAKGHGVEADRLVSLAREAGVPVVEHRLAGALSFLETGRPVDPDLLGALAEIYAGLFELDASLQLAPRTPGSEGNRSGTGP